MSDFPNQLGELVYLRSYARWDDNKQRREKWLETVDRVYDFVIRDQPIDDKLKEQLFDAILLQSVMPSMRALWSSGDFASSDNTSIYNCSFLPIDCIKAFSELLYLRSYARWDDNKQRREKWLETVDRVYDFVIRDQPIDDKLKEQLFDAILLQSVMPSMRALWSSGDFASSDNTSIYNCSFLPIDCIKAFSELLYILMQGTGVGFSVEKTFIENLPVISEKRSSDITTLQVQDSSEGWADCIYFVMCEEHKGNEVSIDYSLIRPRGSILKTKGGRASGPEPLISAVDYIQETIRAARGRRLKSIEVYDICCKLAEVVVVGGVRRSAMICFSDPEDIDIRHAKDWKKHQFPIHRYMSNNSAYYAERPTRELFDKEWKQLAESGSG